MTDTSLMTHAMALLGVTPKHVATFWLLPGRRVTRVYWQGCMADVREVDKVGRIVRRESRWQSDGILVRRAEVRRSIRRPVEWPGIIVRYPTGDQWEALQDVRFIGGRFGSIEVWR